MLAADSGALASAAARHSFKDRNQARGCFCLRTGTNNDAGRPMGCVCVGGGGVGVGGQRVCVSCRGHGWRFHPTVQTCESSLVA